MALTPGSDAVTAADRGVASKQGLFDRKDIVARYVPCRVDPFENDLQLRGLGVNNFRPAESFGVLSRDVQRNSNRTREV